MQLLRNADLKSYNTFGIAAKAELLARFGSVADLRSLLTVPELADRPRLVLGGGSNVLFTHDFQGVVLLNEIPGIDVINEDERTVLVKAGAGVVWHELVLYCVQHGFGGIENLSLIPGKVGAAPMQNIGAYGVEIKDTFHSLEALRTSDGEVITFDKAACNFGYRESFFKREGRDRFVILSVTFQLNKAPHALNTSYGNIIDELERTGITQPTITDVSNAVIAIRRSKLPDPTLLGNAGSFFKNPVVPKALAEKIKASYPDAVAYPAGDGLMKLAAGWLIEKAGWKGHRAGACGVHDRQALVIVNHGGATGQAVYDLSEQVLQSVKDRFGVELEREVNIL
ncbi:MAG: UDP-N-acetylmuramate dehydrogenase [Flavobacteriales bacterium]|nr:UDP-N-acetylmuramate dehydrogenase [Flavobacteriales bacterium]